MDLNCFVNCFFFFFFNILLRIVLEEGRMKQVRDDAFAHKLEPSISPIKSRPPGVDATSLCPEVQIKPAPRAARGLLRRLFSPTWNVATTVFLAF